MSSFCNGLKPPGRVLGKVIGLPVHAGDLLDSANFLCNQAISGQGGYICAANVHMLVTARSNPAFRAVLDGATLITSDGMPLVWELRRKGFREAERVYGPDLMVEVLRQASNEGIPVFFYGGKPGNIELFRKAIAENFPSLTVSGIEAPPLLPEDPPLDSAILERISASGAKLVFVGLGCPKQEFWMRTHAPHLSASLIGVGAAFDFLAGNKPHAPRWVQRAGCEWLYRLLSEPRRLWRRYLVTNTLFLGYLTIDCLTSLKRTFNKEENTAKRNG